MNVAVTGGAGFIGSHMVDRCLAEGHNVTVVDNYSTGRPQNLSHHEGNENLTLAESDINDTDKLTEAFEGVDWIFHYAALGDIVPSIQKPREYFRSNVDGTFSVLEAARKNNTQKLVYAASSSCYGIPDQYPTREDAEIRTEYPYALTKYLAEQMILHWGKVYGLPVNSLRIFNAYGPRSRTSGTYGAVFGVFLAQKLAGKPFTVVGDGKQTRDFVYVTDVVDAFYKAAETDVSGEVMNVGAGNPQSVNRLVELLEAPDVIHIPKRPGEPDCTHADITRIRKLLGWKPKVGFEDGVKEMLDNIDYWRNAPVWDPEKIRDATKDWFKYLGK